MTNNQDDIYDKAKENDLVSSICVVKILYQEVLRYAVFCDMYFVFRCTKN